MFTVDDLLGNQESRYFGKGHKRTIYNIKESPQMTYGEISHTGVWSAKTDKVIQPHLSTLDGIILASLLSERILKDRNEDVKVYFCPSLK